MARVEEEEEERERLLVVPAAGDGAPEDRFGIGYLVFFTLGAGFLLPWNAFITAVDYFSYLYPGEPVDRVFSVAYMLSCLLPLLFLVACAHKSSAPLRINSGLSLFTLALLAVPLMDALYVHGRPRIYPAFHLTVAATALCGVADALVQGGVVGLAGELPDRYMQAVVAGTAASGSSPLPLPTHLFPTSSTKIYYYFTCNYSYWSPVMLDLELLESSGIRLALD